MKNGVTVQAKPNCNAIFHVQLFTFLEFVRSKR